MPQADIVTAISGNKIVTDFFSVFLWPVVSYVFFRYLKRKQTRHEAAISMMKKQQIKNSKKREMLIKLEQIKNEAFKRAIFNSGSLNNDNWGVEAEKEYERIKDILMREFDFVNPKTGNNISGVSDIDDYVESLDENEDK